MRRVVCSLGFSAALVALPAAAEPRDLWTSALEASGWGTVRERREAGEALRRQLASVLEQARRASDADRGAVLLRALHGAVFKQYDARATTLRDVLSDGRYNCVSSAVVYAGAASELGLAVQAELEPTHARVRVKTSTAWVAVETTSPDGFDPPPSAVVEIRRRVAAADPDAESIVPAAGLVAPPRALVGALWLNRAVIAQAGGRVTQAANYLGRATEVAPELRAHLAPMRAALLSQLAVDDIEVDTESTSSRAIDTLTFARALAPSGSALAELLEQNQYAAFERWVKHVVTPGAQRAARARAEARARSLGGSPAAVQTRRAMVALRFAEVSAETGAFEAALRAVEAPADWEMPASAAALKRALIQTRAHLRVVVADARAMTGDLAGALRIAEASAMAPKAKARLFGLAGAESLRRGRLVEARPRLERCLELSEIDPAQCRPNLVALLQRQLVEVQEADQCEALADLATRLAALAPDDPLPEQVRVTCWMDRAERAFHARSYASALASLVRIADAHPRSPHIERNLSAVAYAWADAAPAECPQISSALDTARRAAPDLEVDDDWRGRCAPTSPAHP